MNYNPNSAPFDELRPDDEVPHWYDRRLAIMAVRSSAAIGAANTVLRD